jgi:hypothetical protein
LVDGEFRGEEDIIAFILVRSKPLAKQDLIIAVPAVC